MDVVLELASNDSQLRDAATKIGAGAAVAASRFVVELYSRQGSDPFNPARGTAWPDTLATPGSDLAMLSDIALVSVETAVANVKRAQRLARSPLAEQLDAVVLHGVELVDDVVVLEISVVTAAGVTAQFSVRGGR
jgi:hypothetical protein